jgi:hypothetical protein
MIFDYCPALPPEIKALVESLIERHAPLLPAWVAEVYVQWAPGSEANAEVTVSDEYRRLTLSIGPGFLTFPGDRSHTIRHEFCHAYTIPISARARECICKCFDSETPGTRIAEHAIQQRMEAATEDLAIMLRRVLP